MKMARVAASALVLAAGAAASGYLYAHALATKKIANGGSGVMCAEDQVVKKENPNKMLFISCGGFL